MQYVNPHDNEEIARRLLAGEKASVLVEIGFTRSCVYDTRKRVLGVSKKPKAQSITHAQSMIIRNMIAAERSHAEIADAIGRKVKTVWQYLKRNEITPEMEKIRLVSENWPRPSGASLEAVTV